jgi:hypothetical protein
MGGRSQSDSRVGSQDLQVLRELIEAGKLTLLIGLTTAI